MSLEACVTSDWRACSPGDHRHLPSARHPPRPSGGRASPCRDRGDDAAPGSPAGVARVCGRNLDTPARRGTGVMM
jgi:hypothetical protein